MGRRTLPVAGFDHWVTEIRSNRPRALLRMREWIVEDVIMRASSLPDMLVTGCEIALSGPSVLRASYEVRENAIYQQLRSDYMARRGVADISRPTRNKLHVLSHFSAGNDVTTLLPLHRLYLIDGKGLRASLPSLFVATIKRRVVLLCLYYDDAHPIYTTGEMTVAGKNLCGALNLAFIKKRAVDERGDVFDLPTHIADIVTFDISRQRKDAKPRTYHLSGVGGLFLNRHSDSFNEAHALVSELYHEACGDIGFDPATGKKIGEPSAKLRSSKPKKAA